VVRLLLVGGVAVLAVGGAWLARALAGPRHPPLTMGDVALPRSTGVPLREVTHELEAGLFTALGVEAVPLTLVVDQRGDPRRLLAGVPGKRTLRRALAAAGW